LTRQERLDARSRTLSCETVELRRRAYERLAASRNRYPAPGILILKAIPDPGGEHFRHRLKRARRKGSVRVDHVIQFL